MIRASLLLLLASCAPSLPPAPRPASPPSPSEAETAGILSTLERAFYDHWGAVEATAPYARLSPAHVPLLRRIAEENGEPALMALRVLERLAPEETFTPEARAILYAAALSRETNFRRWGVVTPEGFLPGVYGAEMAALGEAVVPLLRDRLRDTRRAWVFGAPGEEANRLRADRVCDYAWFLLAGIRGLPLDSPERPERRDPLIRDLERRLK